MRIKAIIVAYAFLVQYFKNATIVAYVGIRVKLDSIPQVKTFIICLITTPPYKYTVKQSYLIVLI